MNISSIFLFILFSPLHNMRGQAHKLTNRKSDGQKCKRELQVFISAKLFKFYSIFYNYSNSILYIPVKEKIHQVRVR